MKRIAIGVVVLLGLATTFEPEVIAAQTTSPANTAVTDTSSAETAADHSADPALALGTVKDDTLFVGLPRIVDAALAYNEMLAASEAMRDAAGAEALGAWRGFLPRIQLAEYFLRSDDALSAFGFQLQNRAVTVADFNPAVLNHPGERNNFISRVMLMQPIFNGLMGLKGKQAADAANRAAGYQYQRARETVVFQAVQAFEGLALARAYDRVLQAALASAKAHANQARAMVAADMATEADLLQAVVFKSAVEQKMIEVRNMVAVAGENIELLTACPTTLPMAPDVTLEHHFGHTLPDSFDTQGVATRADLQMHLENREAAGKMVGVAAGALLPHINLSLQRDFYSLDHLFGDDARSWTLGVYGTWDIFSGLENVGKLKKAKAESRATQYMYEFETRKAHVEAKQAWLEARAAQQKVEVARGAVDAAREGLRIVSNQYREGLASMVDLLDIQASATQAEGDLVQALHDYNVGLARLRFAGVGAPLGSGRGAADTTRTQLSRVVLEGP
jgi:outer membrane protein TolC